MLLNLLSFLSNKKYKNTLNNFELEAKNLIDSYKNSENNFKSGLEFGLKWSCIVIKYPEINQTDFDNVIKKFKLTLPNQSL